MPQNTSVTRAFALLVSAALATTALAGCNHAPAEHVAATLPMASPAVAGEASDAPTGSPNVSLSALAGPRLRPDVLVTGSKPLTAKEVHQVAVLAPGAVAFAAGTIKIGTHPVHVASVDPTTFRRFAAAGTAESTPVWQTIANGGVIASHHVAKLYGLGLGKELTLTAKHHLTLRLGALATTGIPDTDLLVSTATGRRLGLTNPTAVVLSAGAKDAEALASKVREVTGNNAEVDLLTQPAANPVAFLTGSRAAHAFGAFSYKYFADGTIQPDARWVSENIASTTVPILGRVTCHRLMIPQLRGALQDVVKAGLASKIHSYDGCYVPRFIERNPTHAISLHTWGIAIDLDAVSNQRGGRGTMDMGVVNIFKRWGFRWGGDWSYTDPMHFEIGALLNS
ncbi:MAG: family peptidase [Frankiales bacterium]|nr:family peptidase [Frankiales bacterium]